MEEIFFKALENSPMAVICLYLLKRVVTCIDKNTTAIDALREEIRLLKSSLKK